VTWTTLLLVFVIWSVVSVVVGFALAYLFGGMTRVRPDEIAPGPAERLYEERQKVSERFPRRRVKARPRGRPTPQPVVVAVPADPPLDDGGSSRP
jgi:hypothetical protein